MAKAAAAAAAAAAVPAAVGAVSAKGVGSFGTDISDEDIKENLNMTRNCSISPNNTSAPTNIKGNMCENNSDAGGTGSDKRVGVKSNDVNGNAIGLNSSLNTTISNSINNTTTNSLFTPPLFGGSGNVGFPLPLPSLPTVQLPPSRVAMSMTGPITASLPSAAAMNTATVNANATAAYHAIIAASLASSIQTNLPSLPTKTATSISTNSAINTSGGGSLLDPSSLIGLVPIDGREAMNSTRSQILNLNGTGSLNKVNALNAAIAMNSNNSSNNNSVNNSPSSNSNIAAAAVAAAAAAAVSPHLLSQFMGGIGLSTPAAAAVAALSSSPSTSSINNATRYNNTLQTKKRARSREASSTTCAQGSMANNLNTNIGCANGGNSGFCVASPGGTGGNGRAGSVGSNGNSGCETAPPAKIRKRGDLDIAAILHANRELDANTLFFLSLARQVRAMPAKCQSLAKMRCMIIVNDLELECDNVGGGNMESSQNTTSGTAITAGTATGNNRHHHNQHSHHSDNMSMDRLSSTAASAAGGGESQPEHFVYVMSPSRVEGLIALSSDEDNTVNGN